MKDGPEENRAVVLPIRTTNKRGREIIDLCTRLAAVLLEKYCDYNDDSEERKNTKAAAHGKTNYGPVPFFHRDFDPELIHYPLGDDEAVSQFTKMLDEFPFEDAVKGQLREMFFAYGWQEGLHSSKITLAIEIFAQLLRAHEKLFMTYAKRQTEDTINFCKKNKTILW